MLSNSGKKSSIKQRKNHFNLLNVNGLSIHNTSLKKQMIKKSKNKSQQKEIGESLLAYYAQLFFLS